MIIVLKPRTTKDDVSRVENMVKKRGLNTHVVQGEEMTVIGCIGDTAKVDSKLFEIDSAVDKVMHVQEEEIDNSYRNDSDPACLRISLKDTE